MVGYVRIKTFHTCVLTSISAVFIFEVGIPESIYSYLYATILHNFPLLNNAVIIAV